MYKTHRVFSKSSKSGYRRGPAKGVKDPRISIAEKFSDLKISRAITPRSFFDQE